jgi:uncharacterized membrane protein YphA (DoxX/SURF4 family)
MKRLWDDDDVKASTRKRTDKMEIAVTVTQIIIALGILNVWVLRFGKPTEWRGGSATNMKEEFQTYGLPGWTLQAVGLLKLTCAACLVIGIWIPALVRPAAVGLAILMLGAVSMHVKVKDPLKKSLPALTMLVLSVMVAAS